MVCLPSQLNAAAHVRASVKKHVAGDVLYADAPGRDSGIGQGADIVLCLFPAFAPFAGFLHLLFIRIDKTAGYAGET
jgi:hypothetical protein